MPKEKTWFTNWIEVRVFTGARVELFRFEAPGGSNPAIATHNATEQAKAIGLEGFWDRRDKKAFVYYPPHRIRAVRVALKVKDFD